TGDLATANQEDPLTSLGIIAGTAPYMSPEQVQGSELDGRSDIFSLGTVLYEMATGKRAFTGKNMALTVEAVLNRPPVPAIELNPDLPAQLADIIERALEKDRSLRYQSAQDLCSDLRILKHDTDTGQAARPASGTRFRRTATIPRKRWLIPIFALVASLAVAAAF